MSTEKNPRKAGRKAGQTKEQQLDNASEYWHEVVATTNELGISIKTLADKIGITAGALHGWRHRLPKVDSLEKMRAIRAAGPQPLNP